MKNIKEKAMLLQINDFAYQSYRQFVKGNFNKSKEEVAKKLTRNVMLSTPKAVPNTRYVWYSYGALKILVKNGKKISCVINNQPFEDGWEVDQTLKTLLNKKLGISDTY